jgi:Flp pilus assembly protein TadG
MIDQPNTPGQANRIRKKSRFGGFIGRFIRDRHGNMGPLIALMLVPLIGVIGVASETGSWFMVQRSMQNAADSAALAAATNAGANYVTEARSVTASYGFTNGANNTTVAVVNNDNTIPAVCGGACYKVTITRNIPIYLTRIVGYNGSVALGGDRAQTVSTLAIATPQVTPTSYCLLSLGSGDGFHINGGNNVNLHGCNVRANGDVTCNGTNSNGGANNIVYFDDNKKCTPSTHASSVLADPYAAQAANIPPNPCGGAYPQEVSNAVDAAHRLTGNVTWGALQTYCGDVMLTGNVNLTTASPGTVLVIYNGKLDMNGKTLLGLAGSGLTIIFSGTNGGGYSHIPTGGGTLDFAAPRAGSGTWSGYALYQDPALTTGVDMTAAGNSPTWDITGLIYLPKSDVQFSGAVNKATNGLSCFALVDSTFQSNGTGDILENQSQCAQAGVILPADGSIVRVSLVQ